MADRGERADCWRLQQEWCCCAQWTIATATQQNGKRETRGRKGLKKRSKKGQQREKVHGFRQYSILHTQVMGGLRLWSGWDLVHTSFQGPFFQATAGKSRWNARDRQRGGQTNLDQKKHNGMTLVTEANMLGRVRYSIKWVGCICIYFLGHGTNSFMLSSFFLLMFSLSGDKKY